MQVQWYNFLQQLNVVCKDDLSAYHGCPLHPNTQELTLKVYKHPVTNNYHFRCIHNKCRFDGDAIQLLARVRGCSIKDAVMAFTTHPLSTCIKDTLLTAQVQDYLDNHSGQIKIKEYVARCNDVMFKSNVSVDIRNRLLAARITNHASMLSPELCAVDPVDPPQPLAVLSKQIYHTGRYLLYPYYFEGAVTQISTQKIDKSGELGPVNNYMLNASGLGVFPSRGINTADNRLIVCEAAITACMFIKHWRDGSLTIPPIVHALGFPLPRACGGKKLCLMDAQENPLSLEYAMRAYGSDETILGEKNTPLSVIICTLKISPRRLRSGVALQHNQLSILNWLSKTMIKYAKEDRLASVMDVAKTITLSDDKRKALIDNLQKHRAPSDLIHVITDAHMLERGELRLANNMRVIRREGGLYSVSTTGTESPMSNVLIRVDSRIMTSKNELRYNCSFNHRDAGVVRGQLSSSDIKTAAKLQAAITAIFINANVTRATYIACYDGGKYYQWPDILAKLSEGVCTYKEVRHLGIDDNLNLQMPNFTLDLTQASIQQQDRVFTLTPEVLNCYSGLIPGNNNTDAIEITRRLLEGCDNQYIAAFMLGVSQVIYTLFSQHAAKTRMNGRQAPRTHLCYAEPADGIWGGTLECLGLLFGDCPSLPHIETNAREHLTRLTELGNLPYISYLPNWTVKKLPELFHDSPVNLITRIDGVSATLLSEESTIVFIMPASYNTSGPNAVNLDDVYALQQGFPALLRYLFTHKIPAAITHKWNRLSRPAYDTYLCICDILRVEPKAIVNNLIDEYYTAADVGSVQAFCAGLNKLLYKHAELRQNNQAGIDVIKHAPTNEELDSTRPPMIYITKHCAIIHKGIVDVVRRITHDSTFRTTTLEQNLQHENYLIPPPFGIDIDTNSYWTFNRKMWDTYIKQERWVSTAPLPAGKIIHLDSLIA